MKHIKPVNAYSVLKQFVRQYPTQTAAARALKISGVYLSDVLNYRRDFSDNVLDKIGLRRITTIVRKA